MPETYTQEQIHDITTALYGWTALPRILPSAPGTGPDWDIGADIRAILSALSIAERERGALKARCAELGKAGDGMREGVDEDQYPNETEAWDSAMTALMAQVAGLEARMQSAGWISVEERKPEIGSICLVAKAGEVLGFSQWGSKDIPMPIWVMPKAPMYAAWIGQEITHWMPLPEPPAIVGKKEG